ncbi:glycolate oxidase subunit GlcF [Acidiphilium sp. AL]|uniref:Glycolate oxidase iron-sulfur subunit n=1 Tax=Acidiphilium iwatense TaxID=768198 RepID=A0ABS9DXH4_9PROT|nr:MULTISPECIES: glycolate oxidase subunit GlcF [Acidiphilium]MCF3947449.1 glycolate oxidase subunit GlcF [Acidiphilium iwatense]MCU4160688.1 glycolate oxidase subunit GlcF [Acidiphilium sp. AL]
MQTSFTAEQLAAPDIAIADRILRSCVHCGFCTATCPSFVVVGDEDDSPRGRIYLIKDMLETGAPASEPVAFHLDRCLSCLACMTTCPSGVDYMHLIDYARVRVEETYQRPRHDRALRALLAAILPYPARLRAALRGARLARFAGGLIGGETLFAQRLRAMLDLAPGALPGRGATERQGVFPPQGTRRARVALLAGCAQQVLDPGIHDATIRLLTRMGVEVVVARGAGCCGALTHHLGKHAAALDFARANVAAWSREIDTDGLDAIVTDTSGCGTVLKDYGFLLRDTPEAERAARIASLAVDISELLLRLDYQPSRPPEQPITLAYHAACSLQHGQKITDAPKILLKRAGFTVAEPRDAHLCCGSAGTYNILQPDIAGQLRARKLETIKPLKPHAIAAGNIGCLTQLGGAGLSTIHTVELLDWMAGGPRPAQLPAEAAIAATQPHPELETDGEPGWV